MVFRLQYYSNTQEYRKCLTGFYIYHYFYITGGGLHDLTKRNSLLGIIYYVCNFKFLVRAQERITC